MYLWQGNTDTLYRIHGTVEPWTIGRSVSSGCIRMINQTVIDLYQQTPVGARVVVPIQRNLRINFAHSSDSCLVHTVCLGRIPHCGARELSLRNISSVVQAFGPPIRRGTSRCYKSSVGTEGA